MDYGVNAASGAVLKVLNCSEEVVNVIQLQLALTIHLRPGIRWYLPQNLKTPKVPE